MPYCDCNIALGAHWALGHAFRDAKVSSTEAGADFNLIGNKVASWYRIAIVT